ncbi:MAG: Holliday junction branch migration protein RuvA [Pseudomonadales bacterium]|nr:Holliday junction branch migration protein RuvA [Pseudomonadales bacterium]MBO6563569.1 Holliday junction branch migration protein RuvA [Pseudomonadales bacterium]MBO6594358.1 Holliday junction branch migration protein RuvA [Pseudomonadales bacterium]MBO6655534.1 Holliday junction branch migration protein RuvA [Pseudomonadales bacterium]MBO6700859.1 Holliday junction branch migration protein RuvA [Pseudomonadales bacterium]
MIGRLMGSVIERTPGVLLLDVSGVGYEVEISLTTSALLSEVEGPVVIHTHLVVRDDAHLLYGFATLEEREMFRTLIRVNGVGPKMALGILSGLDAEAFARAVLNDDLKSLTALPGVGKKTAERLIIEMRDKVEMLDASLKDTASVAPVDINEDAESALIGLGYKPQEAARAIAQVEDPAEDVETLIRQALKVLMNK